MAEKKDAPEEPQEEAVSINIGNINEGAAISQFDLALEKVLANIVDLSTVATATRSITLQVVFKPHSDRIKVETEIHVSAKLAAAESHKGTMFVGKTEEGGFIALDADPRQMQFWSVPKPQETPVIKFSNGK
jgi:hypothetical protein